MRTKSYFSLLVIILLAVLTTGLISFPVSAKEDGGDIIQISPNGQGRVHAVTYSPDGKVLAVGSSLGIHLFNSSDLQLLQFISTKSWVRALAYSPDGSMLASGSYDSNVRLWRTSDGTLLKELTGHTAWVRSLVFSPDGRLLATASDDDTVRLWNMPEGEPFLEFTTGVDGVRALAFSPNGNMLATGGFDKIIRFWDLSNGNLLQELTGHTDWVRTLVFSPDGESLASGAFDATVRLWRVSDGALLVTRKEHASSVLSLAFSLDGSLLASASVDTTVRLWSMPVLEPYDLLRGHTDFVYSAAFSPDGRSLVSGALDNTARIWEVGERANPRALEEVDSPSNCKACHHPQSDTRPARVIETGCAACHQDGALVLDWCPVLPRASGGTTLQVYYNKIKGEKAGVPLGTPDLGIVITTPGNGTHLYSFPDITTLILIKGIVVSQISFLEEIELQLEVWRGSERLSLISGAPDASGKFSFTASVRPGGVEPYPGFLGRNYCVACHQEAQTILPEGEVRLIVAAITPDGTRASDERWIYVDHSGKVLLPVQVLLEDGQPAPNIPVQAETRLYEWRGRTYTTTSDLAGETNLDVEALSQNPTTYKIFVPPSIVDGMLYESKENVEIILPPGATTTSEVTIHVQMVSGEISGTVNGLDSPIEVWAISLPFGDAQKTVTSSQNTFQFSHLPVGQYLLVAEPQMLAEQSLDLSPRNIDLFPVASAQLELIPQPLDGSSLTGRVMDESGATLPFAWVSVDMLNGKTDPASGVYALFDLPADSPTAIVSAPGYFSQAHNIKPSPAFEPSMSFNLVRRPDTLVLPWGEGTLVIPPETVSSQEGQTIRFEQGWLWGKGESQEPIVIQWEDWQIKIPGGEFALERLPATPGWLYVMDGQASIQKAGADKITTIQAGEMVLLSQSQKLHPVAYHPIVAGALRVNGEVPIAPAWQPSISAQVRDWLSRIGIGTVQTVTFITYFMEVLALLAMLLLAVNWIIKNRKGIKKTHEKPNSK